MHVCVLQEGWHLWETGLHTSHSCVIDTGSLLALQMSVGNCISQDTSFSDRNLTYVETSTDVPVMETSAVL